MVRYDYLRMLLFSLYFFIVLLSTDYFVLTKVNAYQGYINNFSFDKLIVSLLTVILVLFFLPKAKEHGKKFFFALVVFCSFLPSLVHFVVTADYNYYLIILLSNFLILFFIKFIKITMFHFYLIRGSELYIIYILFFFIAGVVLYVIASGGLAYWNLNIADVYLYRREAAANLPGFMGYIISSIAKVLLPLLLVLALKNKKYYMVILGFVLIVFQFGLFSHKESLFNGVVAMLVYYAARKKVIFEYTLWGMFFLVSISFIDALMFIFNVGEGWLLAMFSNRTLLVPALLTDMYIQYFSNVEPYIWCYSKITFGLIDCTETLTPPFVIGREYFGDSEMSANVGIIGSGYANLHIWGVLMYSILAGLSISILNSFSKKLGYPLALSISILIVFNQLTSTDYLTSLLSNGLLLVFIFFTILPISK